MPPTLLGLPYDARSSFLRGPAAAPSRIRAALHSPAANLFTETLVDLGAPGALRDAGDAAIPPDAPGPAAVEAIDAAVTAVLDAGGRPISLGGDHSVSFPALRAVRRAHPRLAVLHVDAHPDLYDIFDGDPLSHACPFARVMEARLADQLVQVGIRAMNGHQRAQAQRFGVEVIDMRAWAEGRRPALRHPAYVSIDLDGLDPAHAPGVSHREPGGLTVREVLGLLQRLGVPVVAADVVEYNPARDPDGVTAPVAAKLVKELAGAMHATHGPHAGPAGA